ncbi:hypothetical protein [Bradyrhizobium sp. RDM4]|uniref:hypothetical protein n=1 Tax=Bradyrhizobium sp. RDM4 TaxID=3378765 RepID=UPI0038FC101D
MSRLPIRIKPRRPKFCYVGAPAYFKLQQACTAIWRSWHRESFGCYVVGSCLERPDFRDVDVRLLMRDEAFRAEFPDVERIDAAVWEHDPKWLLVTVSIAEWLRAQTGLPVDFQVHPVSYANANFKGNPRQPVGITYVSPRDKEC